MLMYCFDCMPLAAKVSESYIAMHGGINTDMARNLLEV